MAEEMEQEGPGRNYPRWYRSKVQGKYSQGIPAWRRRWIRWGYRS